MVFPILKTKVKNSPQFDLLSSQGRREYFDFKAGDEIKKLRKYLENNSFIAYLLGKKNSGKGTYSKMFMEVVGSEYVTHISIGDLVRQVHKDLSDKAKKEELIGSLKENYRGYLSLDEALRALSSRNTKTLLPTEFILALVKKEISKRKRKLFLSTFSARVRSSFIFFILQRSC